MKGEWMPRGLERVAGNVDRIPPFDPRSGWHLWIMTQAHRIDPKQFFGEQPPLLDHESLVLIVGPGCFYCEELYTPMLASRRCKGHG